MEVVICVSMCVASEFNLSTHYSALPGNEARWDKDLHCGAHWNEALS